MNGLSYLEIAFEETKSIFFEVFAADRLASEQNANQYFLNSPDQPVYLYRYPDQLLFGNMNQTGMPLSPVARKNNL